MRRGLIWAAGVLGVLIALPALLLVGANTPVGRHAIEALVPRLTGDLVRIDGLTGRFPDALRVERVELRDTAGAYLTVADVAVDWSPLRLVHGDLDIERLDAANITLHRLPVPSSGGGTSSLPVRVIVRALDIHRFEVAAPVAGHAVALSVAGSAALDNMTSNMTSGSAKLTAQAIDGGGSYQVDAAMGATGLRASVTANEPAHGLLSGIAGLPELGAIALNASLDGPLSAVATRVTVSAGPLRAAVQGQVDLDHLAADVAVTANAAAMAPRADLSWQSVALDAKLKGSFSRPDVTGNLRIEQLAAGGANVGSVTAELSGNAGAARLHAEVTGIRLPGAQPDLLAEAPVQLDAAVQLDAPDRPVRFSLRHKLVTAEGTAQTAGGLQGQVSLTLPDLAPLAAAAGAELHGSLTTKLTGALRGDATQLTADGTLSIIGGPAVVGDAIRFSAAAAVRGETITLSRLKVDTKDAALSANGTVAAAGIALDWTLGVPDLAAVQTTLLGTLRANGHISGTQDNLAATADVNGEVGAPGFAATPVSAHLEVHGVPQSPSGTLTARGDLLGAPLDLAIQAERRDGVFHVSIDRANWKSAHAEGALSLTPPATVPDGSIRFSMQRLEDLAPLLGRGLAGNAVATLTADAKVARLHAELHGAAVPGVAAASHVVLNATVEQPAAHPVLDATLTVDGLAAGGVAGSATLRAQGTQDSVALSLAASLPNLAGAATKVTANGRLDAQRGTFDLAALQATWRQETLRLLAPVRIGFTNGIALDRLRIGLRQAVLEASGRIAPTLDLTASLRNLPADIAAAVVPSVPPADGTIGVEARLTGTTARPIGTVTVTAKGLRLRTGPGRALPAADINATARLAGTAAARLDVRIVAGTTRLSVTGQAPLGMVGALDLRSTGTLDLTMLNPLLAANGRRIAGKLELEASIGGTIAAPSISGRAQLTNGEVQDYAQGAHITGISARVEAAGGTVRIVQASGQAGPGTLSASGSVGLLAPGMPIDLILTARNARPLSSDLLTATIDADLTLRGEAAGLLTAGGSVVIRRAEIRVPEKLPSSIATIAVRNVGAGAPPPPARPGPDVALDLTVDAPQGIFVRGRGIDAELGGKVHLTGTAANPQAGGGLTLRRGTVSFGGQTLTFTSGSVSFTGAGIANPALNLVATSSGNNVVATLTVGGTARNPTITLSSVPDLPQDEILAQLLFKRRLSSLGPFELAQIAAGLAELTGSGPGIGNPLARLRKDLGLDRLSVGSSATGGPALEAGRYLAPGIYLGAKQGVSGGSQAALQVDIAKGLKLEATTGAGGGGSATGAAAAESNGSSVGLTYQFEY